MNEIKVPEQEFLGNKKDYYFHNGCCLICNNSSPNCLCYECKCKRCSWYVEPDILKENEIFCSKGKCAYLNPNEKFENG